MGQQPNVSKCTVDESNPCVATCNGQKFDISSVFNYPLVPITKYTIHDQCTCSTRAIGGGYTYSYSPCAGSMCKNDTSSNSAVSTRDK